MAARYSADSREDIDFTDEGEFAEVIRLIKKIYDILNRETFRVHKEKEAFNDVAKKLEHVHFAETLKLNIGGQLFTTSLATVRKDPGSILHGMFSGRFDSKPAEDGSYFIDRDGTLPIHPKLPPNRAAYRSRRQNHSKRVIYRS